MKKDSRISGFRCKIGTVSGGSLLPFLWCPTYCTSIALFSVSRQQHLIKITFRVGGWSRVRIFMQWSRLPVFFHNNKRICFLLHQHLKYFQNDLVLIFPRSHGGHLFLAIWLFLKSNFGRLAILKLHRYPVLRSRNYLFSASTLDIFSAPAPAPAAAIYWHLKLF